MRSEVGRAGVVALIGQRADVNVKTSHGHTPLHWACWNGHAEVAMALLEKGADVNVKTNGGWTPLCCARPEHGGREKLFAMLLEKGAVGVD